MKAYARFFCALTAVALLSSVGASGDSKGLNHETTLDLSKAWFLPTLVVNDDPVCESFLSDAIVHFKSPRAFEFYSLASIKYFDHFTRDPGPFANFGKPDPTMQALAADPYQFALTERGHSPLFVKYRTNSGCGGGCETEQVFVSDQQLPDIGYRDEANDARYSKTDPATNWAVYKAVDGAHFVVAIVNGHLEVFRLVPPARWHLSCRISISPDKLSESSDPAVHAVLESLDKFRAAVGALTRGYGDCGTMGTGGRWETERQEYLLETTYRPWAFGRALMDPGDGPPSGNSYGDYSRIGVQLKMWSLGGLFEHQAYGNYAIQLARSTDELAQFLASKFGWSAEISKTLAMKALTSSVGWTMGFYMYEPFANSNERALRKAILDHRPMSAVRAIQIEGVPLDRVLDSAVTYPDALRYLLSKGANPDWSNDFGKTALMYAAQYNQLESTAVLLGRGADPNAATVMPGDRCSYALSTTEMTPLHYAVRYASSDLIRLLVTKGATTFSAASNGSVLDWLHLYGDSKAEDRNPILSLSEVAELSKLLQVPDLAKLESMSTDLTQRSESDYAAGRSEQAYRELVAALQARSDNETALADLQLVALRTNRPGPSLEVGRTLLARHPSPGIQANVWFNTGLACLGQRFLNYNGKYYCGGDHLYPFLKSWNINPTEARGAKLRELLAFVDSRTCTVGSTGSIPTQYHFEFSQRSDDDNKNMQVQRVYIYHPKSRIVAAGDVHWIIQLSDSGKPVPTTITPNIVQQADLGDMAITVMESEFLAQGVVAVGDQSCKPNN